MSEIYYVVDKLAVEKEGVFDLQALYNVITDKLESLGYDLTQREVQRKAGKLSVSWKCTKEIDDYVQFIIKVKVESATNPVEIGSKKLEEGSITVKFRAQIEKDYEDRWAGPIRRFFRDLYDAFLAADRFKKLENQLKHETYEVAEVIEKFLAIKKPKIK